MTATPTVGATIRGRCDRFELRCSRMSPAATDRSRAPHDPDGFAVALSAMSDNTRRAYEHDAREFVQWCERGGCRDAWRCSSAATKLGHCAFTNQSSDRNRGMSNASNSSDPVK